MAPPEPEAAAAPENVANYDFTKLRINLEIFNGDQKPSPKSWLIRFTNLKELYQWERPFRPHTGEGNGEILACYYMRSFFGAQPLQWLRSLNPDIRKDWDLLYEAFQNRWIKGSSDIANETAFTSAKMKPGESPDDFYLRVLELGELCDASDARISTTFLSGLSREMRLFCCSVQKDSSQKYLESARLFHSMSALSLNQKESSNFVEEQQNEQNYDQAPLNDDYYGETLNYSNDYTNPSSSFYSNRSRSAGAGQGYRGQAYKGRAGYKSRGQNHGNRVWRGQNSRGRRGQMHTQPSQSNAGRDSISHHMRGNQRSRGNRGTGNNQHSKNAAQNQKKTQGACFSCGQQGHTYLQCSDNPKLKGNTCHFCQSKHHFVKDCPYKNQGF